MPSTSPIPRRLVRRALAGLGAGTVALALSALAAPPMAEPKPLFEGGSRRLDVGPTPAGLAGTDAATCAPCHQQIADEWRGSLHAAAWTEPVFQAAYAKEPLAYCRNCHAPQHTGDLPSGLAAKDGVSCATCHVRDGHILGTGKTAYQSRPPHPVEVVAELDESRYCTSCHQFGFLSEGGHGRPRVETAVLQQTTFDEWQARAAHLDGKRCQSCHMPETGLGDATHRAHGFHVQGDAAFIRQAVSVALSVSHDGGPALLATLSPGVVGHAFPTGDLFRNLELRVWADDRPEQSVSLVYGRTYGDRRGSAGESARYVVSDTRVGVGDDVRRLDLTPLGQAKTYHWRLDYRLMAPEIAHARGISPASNVLTLDAGALPAQ